MPHFTDDLGDAQACLRHDHDGVRRVTIKDVMRDRVIADIIALPSMLVVSGRSAFVLTGVVDFFQADAIRRFGPSFLPAIKRLLVSPPIPEPDLIWGCQAAQWAANQYSTVCSGRGGGGGPKGMKR